MSAKGRSEWEYVPRSDSNLATVPCSDLAEEYQVVNKLLKDHHYHLSLLFSER